MYLPIIYTYDLLFKPYMECADHISEIRVQICNRIFKVILPTCKILKSNK